MEEWRIIPLIYFRSMEGLSSVSNYCRSTQGKNLATSIQRDAGWDPLALWKIEEEINLLPLPGIQIMPHSRSVPHILHFTCFHWL